MRRDAKIAALIAVGVLLLFADIFAGSGFYVRDVIHDYLPSRFVMRNIVTSGEFPFWNPYYSGGQPLAANPGYQTFYPPTWLVFLPGFFFGFNLEVVLHIALAATGMYLLLRSMELREWSALFGAVAFALGGAVLSLTSLLPFLTSVAWWPWILMFARQRKWGAFAIALGMLMLAGEQSVVIQTAILLACVMTRPTLPRMAAAAVLAIAIASVQLVPALDLQRDTQRGEGLSYQDATSWSMPLDRPAELFWAHAFGRITDDGSEFRGASRYSPPRLPLIFSIYCGLAVPLLAIAGIALRLQKWTWIAIALSYLLAIGSHGPLIPLLYRIGIYRSMRYPEKFILFGVFAMIVLAACAFDRIDRRFAPFLLLLTLGDVTLHIAELAPRMPGRFFAAPLVTRAVEGPNRIFNLAAWQGGIIERGERTYWSQRSALLPFIPSLYGLRTVYELDINVTNLRPMAALVQSLFESRSIRPFMLMGNAEYLAVPGHPIRIVRGPTLPRYWFADQVVVPHDRDDFVRLVSSQQFSDRVAFVTAPIPAGPGVVRAVQESSHAARIDVDVPQGQPALLVASVTAHRYWRASIDGKPEKLLSANIAFQAVSVPPGHHTIGLEYSNPLFGIFGAVSLISLLIAIILIIYYDQ